MLRLGLSDYDVALNRMFNEVCNRFHMLDPILHLFPSKVMIHGGSYRQVSTPPDPRYCAERLPCDS